MEAFTNEENRWADELGHRVVEQIRKNNFDVQSIIQDCEAYIRDNTISEPFRECMAHAAQFLKLSVKYHDKEILELAELAIFGTMYCNLYKQDFGL